MFYRLLIPICIILIWAPYIQTLGHVWLYTSLILVGAFGLKLLLPHLAVLITILFVWWGVSSIYFTTYLASYLPYIWIFFFGRNVSKFSVYA